MKKPGTTSKFHFPIGYALPVVDKVTASLDFHCVRSFQHPCNVVHINPIERLLNIYTLVSISLVQCVIDSNHVISKLPRSAGMCIIWSYFSSTMPSSLYLLEDPSNRYPQDSLEAAIMPLSLGVISFLQYP